MLFIAHQPSFLLDALSLYFSNLVYFSQVRAGLIALDIKHFQWKLPSSAKRLVRLLNVVLDSTPEYLFYLTF